MPAAITPAAMIFIADDFMFFRLCFIEELPGGVSFEWESVGQCYDVGRQASVAAAAAIAAFVAATVAIAAVVMIATTAASVCGLKLFGGCVAHFEYLAFESDVFACKWVIEVHLYFVVGHFEHFAIDAESVGCHHGHKGAGLDHI